MKNFKNKLIIPFSLMAASAFGNKSTPEYSISKNVLDITLPKTEAVFTFCFSADSNVVSTEIKYSYNGIEKTAKPDANKKITLKVKPGKYVFKFFYTSNFMEITTDSIEIKPSYREELRLHFQTATGPIYTYKPVIYVYPKESTQVKITLDLKGKFSFTYPEYKNGWNFTADPSGTISMNDPEKNGAGKKYDYLFWDGTLKIDLNKINWKEGYIVKNEDQVKFFENKLSEMGLNAREIEDYITFWCPRMSVNEKNYIHFVFNEEYDQYATMNVTPKPDKIFRIYMMWTKANGKEDLVEQKLSSFSRSGFTVVEWGGAELEKLPTVPDLK